MKMGIEENWGNTKNKPVSKRPGVTDGWLAHKPQQLWYLRPPKWASSVYGVVCGVREESLLFAPIFSSRLTCTVPGIFFSLFLLYWCIFWAAINTLTGFLTVVRCTLYAINSMIVYSCPAARAVPKFHSCVFLASGFFSYFSSSILSLSSLLPNYKLLTRYLIWHIHTRTRYALYYITRFSYSVWARHFVFLVQYLYLVYLNKEIQIMDLKISRHRRAESHWLESILVYRVSVVK